LLSRRANIEVANKNGATPLFYAAQEGHKSAVEILLSKGANIEASKNDGCTPLQVATHNDHIEVVKLLVANKANLAVKCQHGTSLSLASEELQQFFKEQAKKQ